MDPIVLAIILVVVMPVAVVWGLSKAASLRGPLPRPEGRKPVEALVTDVVPEQHPDDDDRPDLGIDSAPSDPADMQPGRPAGAD